MTKTVGPTLVEGMSRCTFDVEPFEYNSNGRPIRGRYWQVGWDHSSTHFRIQT